MINMGKFAHKTVLITGASRGIGKEIALKLAQDGANVVIASKTAEPHSKLPGTIYTVAEEVEKLGGKSLPCIVDVRDEKAVEACVEAAVKKFGGIDILINNASAISLTKVVDTQMKTYDLMQQINTRGTFLMSQKCIPYLKNGKNPHILNICPPIVMEPQRFANKIAYNIAKFGSSMCVLGMSEELRPDGIAVNGLWPRTSIWTAAVANMAGDRGARVSRKASIMADAAYAILSRDPAKYTGHLTYDEDILKEEGLRDFSQYAIDPSVIQPLRNFQILTEIVEKIDRTVIQPQSLASVLESIQKALTPENVRDESNVFEFTLKGSQPNKVYVDLKNRTVSANGKASPKVDVSLEFDSSETLGKIFHGTLSTTYAYAQQKLKIISYKGHLYDSSLDDFDKENKAKL
uniref:Hydroxysteroid dehydrogenase-like protein 2 n=1 Tax=Acrobeloides nanus TaxID=290746 RepID=A0A914E653_9BILA